MGKRKDYPSPEDTPSGRAAKRLAKAGMIAAAGPYAAMADAAVQAGSYLYRKYKKKKRFGSKTVTKKKAPRYVTQGKYEGRAKKYKLAKRKIDMYLQKGFRNVTEITGKVTDPDCVYIGHGTTAGHKIMTVFLQAALRKLFKKCLDWNCTGVTEKIPGYQPNSDGLKLVMKAKNMETNITTDYEYLVGDGNNNLDTIERIVGDRASGQNPAWADLINLWEAYAGHAVGSVDQRSTVIPYSLECYRKEVNIGTFWQFIGDLKFENEKINLYVESELKVQNRTLAEDGGADATDVTNNPLIGKVYGFTSSAPRLRITGQWNGGTVLQRVSDANGVVTVRAAQCVEATTMPGPGLVGANYIWREPPDGKVFRNCKYFNNIRINPGGIKKDVLRYKVSMQCHKFFESLGWFPSAYDSYLSAIQMKAKGKFTLFALEDMINVNALQNIAIAYEVNRTEACYLTTMKDAVANGQYHVATQSSVTA